MFEHYAETHFEIFGLPCVLHSNWLFIWLCFSINIFLGCLLHVATFSPIARDLTLVQHRIVGRNDLFLRFSICHFWLYDMVDSCHALSHQICWYVLEYLSRWNSWWCLKCKQFQLYKHLAELRALHFPT